MTQTGENHWTWRLALLPSLSPTWALSLSLSHTHTHKSAHATFSATWKTYRWSKNLLMFLIYNILFSRALLLPGRQTDRQTSRQTDRRTGHQVPGKHMQPSPHFHYISCTMMPLIWSGVWLNRANLQKLISYITSTHLQELQSLKLCCRSISVWYTKLLGDKGSWKWNSPLTATRQPSAISTRLI